MNVSICLRISRLLACLCLCNLALYAKAKWDPIPAEDLAQTACKAYPEAKAEILFHRITIDTNSNKNCAAHYRRVKIYNREGAELAGVLTIEHPKQQRVWGQYARVTKPNGQTADYDDDAFHESVAAKIEGKKYMKQTLAVPDLAPGDILELAWEQEMSSEAFSAYWWYCQTDLPTREFIFDVEQSVSDYDILAFNVEHAELKRISSSHGRLEIRDIPPFTQEVCTPPERDTRGWFTLLYTSTYANWYSNADLWKEISGWRGENFRLSTRPNGAMKDKAAELLQGATDDDEKLKRLYQYCQKNIDNIDYFDSGKLQAAKKKLDDSQDEPTAAKTFALGAGYSRHINAVFASLARAAGFDVRLVQSASRHGTLKVKNARGWLFMNDNLVAVRLGDQWRIFSPGHYYMPYGLLAYQNELTPGLICDEKKPIFQETEAAPASKSVEARIGRFTLDEEGTLEGDVEIRMGGHLGAFRKTDWNDDSVEEIDTLYRAEIAANLPSAEISDLKWENLRAPEEPLIARFKLKVPGYAELAGSRLIFVPNVFEHGTQPLFTPEKRTNPIMFRHAWSEQDDIAIILPEGYMLDGATAPTNMANPETDIVGVRYKLSYQGKQRTLSYKRHFAVGAKGLTILPAQSYEPLKNFFDALHTQDEHKLVIKPKPEPAAAPATP
ncbi:MAG TPA: DUF3857 domain-containing protein [Opitutaceae bacterium]|nr:DUF3857 domain-containing protein [Opitutaceae bacterium]